MFQFGCYWSAILLILVLNTLQFTHGVTINPTTSVNNTELYNITSSTEYDDIICSTTNCQVICQTNSACYKVNIFAQKSDILVLECIDEISCEETKIISGAKDINDIYCLGKSSCYNANFDLSNVSDVNLICNYSAIPATNYKDHLSPCHSAIILAENSGNVEIVCAVWGCYKVQFYVNNSYNVQFNFDGGYAGEEALISNDYIENELIINCNTLGSCGGMDGIFCPNSSTCTINCKVADSCYTTTVFIPNRVYEYLNYNYFPNDNYQMDFRCRDTNIGSGLGLNEVNNRVECTRWMRCCPNQFASDKIICNQDNCNYEFTALNSGRNTIIDGSSALSLTVTCDSADCEGIKVLCPTRNGSSCVFICQNANCDYAAIKANNANYVHTYSFNLVGSHDKALLLLNFTEIDTLNLYHSDYDDPLHIVYGHQTSLIGTFNLTCPSTGCWNFKFLFSEMDIVVSDLIINCRGCHEAVFHFSVSNSVKMLCNTQDTACNDGDFQFNLVSAAATADIKCTKGCGDAKFTVKSSELINENIATMSCHTLPDDEYGNCYGAEFHLDLVDKGVINCQGDQGCAASNIFGSRTKMLDVNCYSEWSCVNTVVFCPSYSHDVCTVTCDQYDDVCRGLSIYPSWDDYVYGYLDLTCHKDEYDCDRYYNCFKYCKDVSFNCYVAENKKNTHLIYDYDNNYFRCNHTSPSYCCPWNASDLMVTQSLNGTTDSADKVSNIYDQIYVVFGFIILKALFFMT